MADQSLFPWSYSPSEQANIEMYTPTAYLASQYYGVPWELFSAQIYQESSFNPSAKSSTSSANGIAQFITSTAADFNLDSNDPVASLWAAAQYDSQLYAKSGDWSKVMNSYGTGTSSPNIQSALGMLGEGTGGSQLPSSSISEFVDTINKYLGMPTTGNYSATDQSTEKTDGSSSSSSSSSSSTGLASGIGGLLGNTASTIKEWFGRVSIVLIGIVLVGGAIFLLGAEKFQKE
jgi:hypothetical protein